MVWLVPSHTKPGKTYRVDATANNGAMHCACPDFRARRQANIDKGLPPLVPRVKGERPDNGTICVHCTDLIFYFCRQLFSEMAKSECTPP